MSQDARLSTALPAHPKTKKLIRRLGVEGAWHLVCLFLWAASNRPDGDLSGMTTEDLELAVDWTGDEGAFVAALLHVRFLDGEEGGYSIHDWHEHNPWAAGADMRSAKARWNAVKRHHGEREADRQVPEWAAIRNESKEAQAQAQDASSSAISMHAAQAQDATRNAPSPSPSPSKSEGDMGAPTIAGQACLLMRKAGCASTNPSHPDLLAALSEGVTPQALADAVTEAKGRGIGNPFVYAIKAARSLHAAGASPTPPPRARAGPTGDRQPPKSRTVQAIQALNEVTERVAAHSEKPTRLDDARTARRPSEAALPEP